MLSSFFTEGPQAKEYLNNKKMPTYLSCRFSLDVFDDYWKCIGYKTWDAEEYAYKLLNVVGGSWFKLLPD